LETPFHGLPGDIGFWLASVSGLAGHDNASLVLLISFSLIRIPCHRLREDVSALFV